MEASKVAAIILGAEPVVEEPKDEDEKVIAAEDVMSALEKKDAKAFAEALESFVELCEYED